VAASAFAFVAALGMRDTGAWTGIVPLERKVRLLDRFAGRGPVDALVLGSSIADYGFSARLFSRLMTRHLGREYRAFNFAVGGSEPRTLPKLYRIARTVVKPRSVFVVAPPEPRLSDAIADSSPDHALQASPAGALLGHELLLRATRPFWSCPLVGLAPAIREMLLSGRVDSLAPALGAEAVPLDANGDRVSYGLPRNLAPLQVYRHDLQAAVRPFGDGGQEPPSRERMVRQYFSPRDAAALEELAALVRSDGGELHVLSHASAAALWDAAEPLDPGYQRAREDFFRAFAAAAQGARLHDAAKELRVPLFALSDTIHLNAYGAELYTRAAFAAMTGAHASLADPRAMRLPPADALSVDGTSRGQSSLVWREDGAGRLLRIRVVDTFAVQALPDGPIALALLTPDGSEVIVPSRRLGADQLIVPVDLPPGRGPEAMVARLLQGEGETRATLPIPIADYEWIEREPAPASPAIAATPMRRAAYWIMRMLMGEKAPRSLLTRPAAAAQAEAGE